MIEPGHIAPPVEHFELGDRVEYHHRACVARIANNEHILGIGRFPSNPASWHFVREGSPGIPWFEGKDPLNIRADRNVRNKTIIIWPEDGGGVVIGLVRREIGLSVSPSSYNTLDGYDHDPGYFAVEERHWLYAIKQSISGVDFVLAPMWATKVVEND